MIIHNDKFIDFDSVLILVFSPKIYQKFFCVAIFEKVITVMTPKKDMGVGVFVEDVSSCIHIVKKGIGKRKENQKTSSNLVIFFCSVHSHSKDIF